MKQCRTPITERVAPADAAGEAAAGLLEVVPAVMRAIRLKMRESTSSELSVVQFRSLALADHQPRGASVSEIAAHIGLTMPSASKLVDVLVRRGYLRRTSDPTDRRMALLVPTTKGRRAMNAARRTTRGHLARMLGQVSSDHLRQIVAALEAMRPVFMSDSIAESGKESLPQRQE
jgi:DNA-binding MarR family transcriptional regulator